MLHITHLIHYLVSFLGKTIHIRGVLRLGESFRYIETQLAKARSAQIQHWLLVKVHSRYLLKTILTIRVRFQGRKWFKSKEEQLSGSEAHHGKVFKACYPLAKKVDGQGTKGN